MQEVNISNHNFETCQKCAICTTVCPVMQANPEYAGPKQSGPDGERLRIKDKDFYTANLNLCLNCKRCEVACPSGVKVADLIQCARAELGNIKPNLRDRILANTDFMGSMVRPFAPIANFALSLGVTKTAMDLVLGVDHRREFPKYSWEGFEKWFKKHAEPSQAAFSRTVNYFHGCYVNYNNPQLGKDFVALMNALGYGVKLLDGEKCCGVAMMSSGLYDKARKNAVNNVAAIQKAGGPTLTTSTSCTLMMREEYPDVLGVDNSAVKDNIILALKFICEKVESGEAKLVFKRDWFARTAYHAPCHMDRLGWSVYTKRLLGMIPGLDLTILDSNCCGIAGTYGFKKEKYETSQKIGKPLFDQIERLQPMFVSCECETCKWQIEMSTDYEVLNPITVLVQALDLEATSRANRR